MLEKIHFQNFKNLKDVHCDLGQLTVIVGLNASGKTSLLECHVRIGIDTELLDTFRDQLIAASLKLFAIAGQATL